MPDLVLIPLPGIGTLSLTREQYEAALIKIEPPTLAEQPLRQTSLGALAPSAEDLNINIVLAPPGGREPIPVVSSQ